MTRDRRSHGNLALAAVLAVAVALSAGACLDASPPSQARAEISGPEGTEVRVITSTRFISESQGSTDPTSPDTTGVSVQVVTADTSRHALPATVNRALTETQRIYINVALPDSVAASADGAVDAEMQLFVDGEVEARTRADLVERAMQATFTSFVSG